MKLKITSVLVLWIWAVTTIAANFYFAVGCNKMMQTISWDKFGYYYYLPAFFYDNPAHPVHYQELLDSYHPGGEYAIMPSPNGNYIMKYSCGMAVMYAPAFFTAHLLAKAFHYPTDGMSYPYQAALNYESLIVAIIGMILLRKILKKYFADTAVAITLLIIGFASNYFQYAAFDLLFQHVYLFTLYACIILLSIRWNEQPSYSTSVLLGLCCGLAALTRPTEIITIAIPFLWGIYDWKTLLTKIKWLLYHIQKPLVMFAIILLVGSLQLIYWKIYAGSWLYYSYGDDQTFSWRHPHVYSVLLSYKKGWLVYTPVMLLSLLGFITLYRNYRRHFWFALLFMLIYFYPVAAWDNWWYGGSFSMRAMIQSYPVLAFPLASVVTYIFSRRILSAVVILFTGFCIWLNGVFTWQAYFSKQGIYNGDMMTNRYFWRVFGKLKINMDDKRFLDTNEKVPQKLESRVHEIYFNDLEQTDSTTDTITAFSGKHSFLLNDSLQLSPSVAIPVNPSPGQWYRFEAKVLCPEMEWDQWKQLQMIIALYRDDQKVKSKFIRVHRMISIGQWQTIYVDLQVPEQSIGNRVLVQFDNAGGMKTVFADDIRLLTVQE